LEAGDGLGRLRVVQLDASDRQQNGRTIVIAALVARRRGLGRSARGGLGGEPAICGAAASADSAGITSGVCSSEGGDVAGEEDAGEVLAEEEEEEEAIADMKARRQHGAWANEAGVREERVRRACRAAGPAMALARTDMADEDEDEDEDGG
jgi:hypothetical protein